MSGIFITFEGPEGSGKTSVIKAIETFLKHDGYDILTTREPGGIKISEQIRSIILSKENTDMDPRAEALLFAASRAQHFHQKIAPALAENKLILCDRFIDSSLAYQGYARGLGIDEVYDINAFAIDQHLPDATIFIDVRPEIGLKRVFNNSRKIDRLDLETLAFHEQVYAGYKILADKYSERFYVVNGENPIETVIEDTLQIIKTVL
ncbi:MAG: dTMP kinase [Candidatus Izimaplasma sp.]|nr:dTMP kinase [Candidatus Izimaplasma bacterium]